MTSNTPTTAADLEIARENQEVHIRIVLSSEDVDQIQSIVENLEKWQDPAVRTITLVGSNKEDDDGQFRHSPDLRGLLAAIGNVMTSVVHLKFENISVDGWTIPAELLTALFRKTSTRLETLECTALQIEGTKMEMLELESTVAGLVCLRSCCFINNFILWLGKEMHPLDGMLQALSKLPLLLGVYLDIDYFNDSGGHASQLSSSAALSPLLGSTNIQELILSKFLPSHPALQEIGQHLKTKNYLQNLTIYFTLPPNDEWNNLPTLESSLECLSSALLVNTSLQELKLHLGHEGKCPKLDSFLVQTAKALETNTASALAELEVIAPCTYGACVEEAFVTTLRTNYSLQKLECFTTSEDTSKYISLDAGHRTEMELYLRLNEQGRKELMTNNTRDTWTVALAKHSHDLDALFYYLHCNPWLMTPGAERPKTRPLRRKRRRQEEDEESLEDVLVEEIQRLRQENATLKASQQKRRRFLRDAAAIVANVAFLWVATARRRSG
ncbi:expressed unknown protein [Seminavis robusta]|uniref:Uncharacterized protein n=1 Tax=Seminavis robusta TaxID=568900 RepID=A0A9N8HXT3_9STRA|nr:expressed unknown protein [Seminavis robusta]|eukprot:Sro3322_g346750.1 n/a (499) ;mRNA; f:831-2327